ncbi:MAG: peptide chain release factor N(5)-glutamine methyltransferase [Akkermansiaceae bacterium]|jgi:release factor glutamine methyltransferase|nr:peptide chain release factor N(5)-glutamine methyltransferase [Akkermansiaceae bacterium]
MTTVLETIDKGTLYLEKRGIADARRNMQSLVAHQLKCTRTQLYVQFDRPLSEAELAPLREALKRRGEGVPLQHLLGSVEFHRREFKTDARALIPRPETEELAAWLLSRGDLPAAAAVLDMGCGSGVLGLTLAAERPDWRVTLADLSPDALALARENADALRVEGVDFVESDLFSNLSGPFDGIVANLPYVPEADRSTLAAEVLHDPALALFGGADGLAVIRRFIPQAFARLRPGGWLAMEIGIHQADEVGTQLSAAGFSDIHIHPDFGNIPRFPFARKPEI